MPATDPAAADWALWRALTLMGRRLIGGLEQRLQAHAGVSVPDYEILAALAAAPQSRLRAGQLGEMLSWEKSRTSHHVARMEARGLVARAHCETDLRGTWVELRREGEVALAAAEPLVAQTIRSALVDVVPADEAEALARAALRIIDASPSQECDAEVGRLADALGVSRVPAS